MPNRVPEGGLFDPLSFGRRGPDRRDRLSPAQIRQIARTVARTPEVMVKVLPSAATSVSAVRQHLAYVGRNGEVALQTDDGQQLQDREAAADLVQDWDLDLAECQSGLGGVQSQRAPKLAHKLVFSMPAGTPPDKVLLATQRFCREQLALKHRYAMALHTDEPHPHVHVIIKAISEQGERLNIRKATLRAWRAAFASHLRRVGVAANATPRFVRGETRPRKSDGIFRAARRGASIHLRDRVEAVATGLREADRTCDPAKARIRETRRDLERGWLATGDALRSQGQSALADQTRQFVRNLPPARTEREWLMAGLLEQGRSRRVQELEMTR
ncbi:MAG: relaxase/mobilization nuclease domain-containing protein [Steroidobacteraceae bacterium]|nr:relaxase/mobilization nuclease domain-containing protein [Steroidobacteraceae bacterium]